MGRASRSSQVRHRSRSVGQDDPSDGSPTNGCAPFTNAGAISGKFVFVDRGACAFADKIDNAVAAGATGIIIGQNADEPPFALSGRRRIYGVMVDQASGTRIKAATSTVNVTIKASDTAPTDDSYRWLSGESDPAFGGAIRDMSNPNCYGDPGKVSDAEFHCSTDDSGGVHSNSGIVNHTFALLVDGGTYSGASSCLLRRSSSEARQRRASSRPPQPTAGPACPESTRCPRHRVALRRPFSVDVVPTSPGLDTRVATPRAQPRRLLDHQ